MAMKSIVIILYEKNAQKIAEVCRDHDIYAFSGKESLDEYIERLRKAIRKNSYIITDEEGGTPFLAALIASADTESRIIFDVNEDNIINIIHAIENGEDLLSVIGENKVIDSLRTDS